jgi:hypothetical protein
MRRLPFRGELRQGTYPLEIVGVDFYSPSKNDLPVNADGKPIGYRYAMVFVDFYSRLLKSYFAKSMDVSPTLFRMFLEEVGARNVMTTQFQLRFRTGMSLHTDGGTNLTSEQMSRVLVEYGLNATVTSAPDSPSSNGLVERMIGVLETATRIRMSSSGISRRHWHHAWKAAEIAANVTANQRVLLMNTSAQRLVPVPAEVGTPPQRKQRRAALEGSAQPAPDDETWIWVSPYQLFYAFRPSLEHFVVFGAPCRALFVSTLDKSQRGKHDVAPRRGKVLYYASEGVQTNPATFRRIIGYVVVLDDDDSIRYTRNVQIDERPMLQGGLMPSMSEKDISHSESEGLPEDEEEDPTEEGLEGTLGGSIGAIDELAPRIQRSSERKQVSFAPDTRNGGGGQSHDHGRDQSSNMDPDELDSSDGDVDDLGPANDPIVVKHGDAWLQSSYWDQIYVGPSDAAGSVPTGGENDDHDSEESDIIAPGEEFVVLRDPTRRRDRVMRDSTLAQRSELAAGVRRVSCSPNSVRALSSVVYRRYQGQNIKVPSSVKEALTGQQADEWWEAMKDHIENSHIRLGVFSEVIVPKSTRLIPCKWVFDAKTDAQGNVIKFKARTAIQGFRQIPGVDFNEVFSPTIRMEQIRILLARFAEELVDGDASAVANGMLLAVLDFKDAYYTTEMPDDEKLLHTLPVGYEPELKAPPGHLVAGRSEVAHPGAKQSGRLWWKKLESVLTALGGETCKVAPCLWRLVRAGNVMYIGHFVDDCLTAVFNTPKAGVFFEDVVKELQKKFVVTVNTEFSKFLGLTLEVVPGEGILLHCQQYLTDLLTENGIMADHITAVDTPEMSGEESGRCPDECPLEPAKLKKYQGIVGSLMFAMVGCRPDIGHAVGRLAKRMSNARVCDWLAARRVLRFLKGKLDYGILFPFGKKQGLEAYADSDYASCPVTRKSTSGNLVLYNGAPISWTSAMQSIVAQSSCEAEFVSACDCSKEVIYLREVLSFLGVPQEAGTPLWVDNQAAIHWSKDPVHHRKSKHVEVRYWYVRDQVAKGFIDMRKVDSAENTADPLTKAVDRPTFLYLFERIMYKRPENAGPLKLGV